MCSMPAFTNLHGLFEDTGGGFNTSGTWEGKKSREGREGRGEGKKERRAVMGQDAFLFRSGG